MRDKDCTDFLQWALPRLGMRWPGFRKVRRQVCKRVGRRCRALGFSGIDAYRRHLENHPEEWPVLDGLCRIPISRFWRDRHVFESLARCHLPRLAALAASAGRRTVRCWSAGCASGEEAYSLSIAWRVSAARRFPAQELRIVATDADPVLLGRAEHGVYGAGSLKDLPPNWRARAFTEEAGTDDAGRYRIGDDYRAPVAFQRQDIREQAPDGLFDLVLCRNMAFTYFDADTQKRVLATLLSRLTDGGLLVIGSHETLPPGEWGLEADPSDPCVHRKTGLGPPPAA